MSQEVMIAGALFSDVPSIRVPDSQGNFHPFTDVSDTTAAAADVASGKYFYAADGTRTAGTSSGGGGGVFELIHSQDLGHIEGTSTATDIAAFQIPLVAGDLFFVAIESDQTTGLKATYTLFGEQRGNYKQGRVYLKNSTDYVTASSQSGVYAQFSNQDDSTINVTIQARTTSTSGTVSGNYVVRIYRYAF